MNKNKLELVTGLAIMLMGIVLFLESIKLPYMKGTNPSAGFLPIWISVSLILCSFYILVKRIKTIQKENKSGIKEEENILDFKSTGKALIVALITVLVILSIPFIGMVLALFIYLVILLKFIGKNSWITTGKVSLLIPIVIYFIFHVWLSVPFTTGFLGF